MLHPGKRRTHQDMLQNPSLGIVTETFHTSQLFISVKWWFQWHKYLTNLFLKYGQSKRLLKTFGSYFLSPLEHPLNQYPLPCMNQEIHLKKQIPSLKVIKYSPLLNVAWIWILELKMSQWHVNSVCGDWFLSLFGEVFSGVSSWSLSTRTNNSRLHCDLGS